MMSPEDVALGYAAVSSVSPPPIGKLGGIEFLDLPLLRSVHPRQLDYLDKLIELRPESPWKGIRAAVAEQRVIRDALYRHVLDQDARMRDSPNSFVFPDPYSLLLWIWTIQLFEQAYAQPPGTTWSKHFYRGEARDYGATRFQPSIVRPGTPHSARLLDVPARARALIRNHPLTETKLGGNAISVELSRYLVGTMSCAQALAVSQHYGFPTPLTDVTVHPEIAMWFATNNSSGDIGVIGSLEMDVKSMEDNMQIAIIIVPPLFTRVRLQSAYFICSKSAAASSSARWKPLRFRHCPELEPVPPTWLMSIGAVLGERARAVDILEDTLELAKAFKREWPRKLPTSFPRPGVLKIEEVLSLAVTDIVIGTGRSGIMPDGRRFSELHPPLLHSMIRHAPLHTYLYAAAIMGKSAAGNGFSDALLRMLLDVFRALIASALSEDNEIDNVQPLASVVRLRSEEVMQITGQIVGPFDDHMLGWPLNSWYEAPKITGS